MDISNLKNKISLTLLLILLPYSVSSLTLGRISTKSLQGEPLHADILLEDVERFVQIDDLNVIEAQVDDYWQTGVALAEYHDDLRFTPYVAKDGHWYIKVNTQNPIYDNFVNFLITVEHPFGTEAREYMAVLKRPIITENNLSGVKDELIPDEYYNFSLVENKDANEIERSYGTKPIFKPVKLAPVKRQEQVSTAVKIIEKTKESKTLKSTKVSNKAKVNKDLNLNKQVQKEIARQVKQQLANELKATNKVKATKKVKAIVKKSKVVQYKAIKTSELMTRSGDTLWEIAKAATTNNNNIHKMVMTIYNNNKSVFINKNINLLKKNKRLIVPSEASLSNITLKESLKFFKLNTRVTSIKSSTTRVTRAKKLAINSSPNSNRANNKIINTNKTTDAILTNSRKTNKSKNQFRLTSLRKSADMVNKQANKLPRLKIVADAKAGDSISKKLLVATEKLIAGQNANKGLKQQVLVLQAQITDIKKLLKLKKVEQDNINQSKSLSLVEQNARLPLDKKPSAKMDTKTAKTLFNPFSTIDIPVIKENVAKIISNRNNLPEVEQQAEITTGNALLENTNTRSSITKTEDSIVANNTITSFIAAKVDYLSKLGEDFVANQPKVMLILMIILSIGLFGIALMYLYWRKYYRLEPAVSDLTAPSESYYINDLADDSILSKDSADTNGIKFKDHFDLVKAYIELNDFVTAKKILNEIVRTGDNSQQSRAKNILENMTAASKS